MAYQKVVKKSRVLGPFKLLYPGSLFNPRSYKGGDLKHEVIILSDKDNKKEMEDFKLLHTDLKQTLEEAWPDKETRPRKPIIGGTGSPIKDGDKSVNSNGIPYVEKTPALAGHFFIKISSKKKPNLRTRSNESLEDSNELYSGCFCKVDMNAYSYDMPANKGVTIGLNGVQKWGEGDHLGGGQPDRENMFEADGGQDDAENYSDTFGTQEGDPLTDDTPDDEISF